MSSKKERKHDDLKEMEKKKMQKYYQKYDTKMF